MSSFRPETIREAVQMLERGLEHPMDRIARAQGEDALWLIKQGRYDDAVEAVCNAVAFCDDHLALQFLHQARDLLAPDRFSSA